ncbi:MAG TPA: PilZ domain-containing protein [Geobacterales bacterium]|nr:PilZ domain-containing protein [Geobacterales bacterium]
MDKRRQIRRAVDVGCWVTDGREAVCLPVFDLSEEGVFLSCRDPLLAGSRVTLHFYTPRSAHALVVEAEVAWSTLSDDRPGMGLRFLTEKAGMELFVGEFCKLFRMHAQP